MKIVIDRSVGYGSLILAAAICLVGCATTGNQRSAQTRTTMGDVERDYVQAAAQVGITNGSLEALLNPDHHDKTKSFEQYSENVKKMKKMEMRLFEHADKMQSQQKNYFEEWRMQGNTYNNPRIQALSEQRRADLTQVFSHIAESSVGVKGSFKAYMSDNEQIRTYLSTDLTPKGIDSITPEARQAIADGDSLRMSIDPVLSAIHDARAELGQDRKETRGEGRPASLDQAGLSPQDRP